MTKYLVPIIIMTLCLLFRTKCSIVNPITFRQVDVMSLMFSVVVNVTEI